MGIGFVILMHLVAIFLISSLMALCWILLTWFFSKIEGRKKKMFFAGIAPFVGLFTLYFFGLFGSIIVSEIKDVDIGFGDCWYVPIKANCKLTFIDLPEQAYLEDDNKTLIENVAYLQNTKDKLVGKTYDDIYFLYNIKSKKFSTFKNETDFSKANNFQELNFIKAMDFYIERRKEVSGTYFMLVGIISLFITILLLWFLRKLILGHIKGKGN
jgi:hypothetical protein